LLGFPITASPASGILDAMRYMLLIYEPGDRPAAGTAEAQAVMEANERFAVECRRREAFVAADPLHPPAAAKTVSGSGADAVVTDGPFAETREWLAGYWMLDCDEQEALELAALCPGCGPGRRVEVRPVLEIPGARGIAWTPAAVGAR
jgi:hypothetical protein